MIRLFGAVLGGFVVVAVAWAQASAVELRTTSLDFGRILTVDSAERTVWVANTSALPLRIQRVALTPPLRVVRMPREIAPGAESDIVVRMDPPRLRGRYDGTIAVFVSDAADPQLIRVKADVVSPIELTPRPMFFVAAVRGRESAASIDIISNEVEPLRIDAPVHSGEHFTTSLQTIEEGKHFRLNLRMLDDAPAGRHTDTITLRTSSGSMPRIDIAANTLMHERVYTFPDSIDLGVIPISAVRTTPALLERVAQTLMVFQAGGRDFQIRCETDVRGLSVRSIPGPQGDRHQLTLTLEPDQVDVGPIRGMLRIATNDARWTQIEVPISGAILPE